MTCKQNRIGMALGVLALSLAATHTAAAECGRVSIANMNWQSAEVLAEVDKIILEKGYGCEVELVPGDTMPTMSSMTEKGQPDVAPELWPLAVYVPLTAAINEGKLHYGADSLIDGGIDGWWIPKYVADANPEIKTIDDALARPDFFPFADDKSMGAVHTCPSGWNCQITTNNAFKAWGAAQKNFALVETGSAAGLDGSIAKAYERRQGWLGYYWAPTAILGKYEMVKLETGVPYDAEAWMNCNTRADCESPKKNDWPRSIVKTVVTDRFKRAEPEAFAYLSVRGWNNETVSALLAWMQDNQATGEDGAHHFLKTSPEVWTSWVSPEIAERVKAGL